MIISTLHILLSLGCYPEVRLVVLLSGVGGQGLRARVILVLREYISNAPAISLVLLPPFDESSPWVILRVGWSFPAISILGDCLPFQCGEYGD